MVIRNIIIGLIMCIVSNNHVFGNVALIEQDITNVLISAKDADTQQNSFNNTIRTESSFDLELQS